MCRLESQHACDLNVRPNSRRRSTDMRTPSRTNGSRQPEPNVFHRLGGSERDMTWAVVLIHLPSRVYCVRRKCDLELISMCQL